jgi:predicted negative regulator of RcsB-dependent stress response
VASAIAAAACLLLALHVLMPGPPASSPAAPLRLVSAAEIISPAAVIMSPVARPTAPPLLAQAHAISVPVPVRRHVELAPVVTKAAVKTVAARPTASRMDPSEARAQAALNSIRRRVSADDPDLLAAALENVALTYPGTGSAAQALLTAADLQRSRGNLAEADASYRRLLSMKGTAAMPRALAHKALADLRSDAVGDDAVTRHHYQEAARALRTETQGGAARPQALVAMADIARETGNRTEAVADYAAAASQGAGEQATTALAEVL